VLPESILEEQDIELVEDFDGMTVMEVRQGPATRGGEAGGGKEEVGRRSIPWYVEHDNDMCLHYPTSEVNRRGLWSRGIKSTHHLE
jgi:hypothetical protein